MRTPSGIECKYFYGNYFRGRNDEECRLIGNAPPPDHWTPDLCASCPVPSILQANACSNMVLQPVIKKGWFGLKRQVTIKAFCTKTQLEVAEPAIGCGECHPLPPAFTDSSS